MRVLICGSRDWTEVEPIENVIAPLGPNDCVIAGGARGADRIAAQVALRLGVPLEEYPADWEKYGKAAGPIRNREMLDRGRPDYVVAFPLGDSRGTRDMIRQARAAGVRVAVYEG